MKRCTACIIPETFPGVKFDTNGVCSLCAKFEEQKESLPSLEKLRNKFNEIIEENKSKNKKYDALVAYSGGKDSTFLIHTLKHQYNLNLLAFTFDNGFMPETSFSNMRTVLDNLGVDHIIFRPRYDLIKKIFSVSADSEIYPLSLLKIGSSVCISCMRMVINMSLKAAIEKSIPMVMLGHSPGQLIQSENEIIYQDNKIPFELKKKLFEPLADKIGEEVYYYFLLDQEQYKVKPFPYVVNPFPITSYDEGEIYNKIAELGWQKPDEVDPTSTNCCLNSLGIIRHKEKLKFHPYDYEMSMLVRLGIISRDEALRRVEDPDNKASDLAAKVAKRLNPS